MLLLITKEIIAQKHYTEKSQFLCWLLIFLYWNFQVLEIRIFPIMSNFNVELQNKQHFVLLKNTRPDLIRSELYIFICKMFNLDTNFEKKSDQNKILQMLNFKQKWNIFIIIQFVTIQTRYWSNSGPENKILFRRKYINWRNCLQNCTLKILAYYS